MGLCYENISLLIFNQGKPIFRYFFLTIKSFFDKIFLFLQVILNIKRFLRKNAII